MDLLKRLSPIIIVLCLLLSAVLFASCTVDGMELKARNNPHDPINPPEVKNVYVNTTDHPLTEGMRLESTSDELLVEFYMAMNQQSVEDALILQDTSDPPIAYEPDLSWPEIYLLRIAAPNNGWPADEQINLVVLRRAENTAEKAMAATFDTFFLTAE